MYLVTYISSVDHQLSSFWRVNVEMACVRICVRVFFFDSRSMKFKDRILSVMHARDIGELWARWGKWKYSRRNFDKYFDERIK